MDRWYSHTPCGQEFSQILAQWIWNLRLELGQKLCSCELRTTEFAKASVIEPAPAVEPVLAENQPPAVQYGPPKFARPSFTGGFPGAAFTSQPDGTLRCPANRPLYPQERRPERDGSLRVLYAARIGDCRTCSLRAQCQESTESRKPRRVSAVLWPLSSPPSVAPATTTDTPALLPLAPVLWKDWPRCDIRRAWLKVIRRETVHLTNFPQPELSSGTAPAFERLDPRTACALAFVLGAAVGAQCSSLRRSQACCHAPWSARHLCPFLWLRSPCHRLSSRCKLYFFLQHCLT